MRSKVKFEGKYYRPVPWHVEGNCDGCALDIEGRPCEFNDASRGSPCDDGREFAGMIFIRHTKEAMAEYIARKLGGQDEMG